MTGRAYRGGVGACPVAPAWYPALYEAASSFFTLSKISPPARPAAAPMPARRLRCRTMPAAASWSYPRNRQATSPPPPPQE